MAEKEEKIACHNCLTIIPYKKGKSVFKNNFGIPHYVYVCDKCYNK